MCCHGDTEANYEMRVETHSTISTVIYSSSKSRHRSQNQCSMKCTKNKAHNLINTVFYTSESLNGILQCTFSSASAKISV